MCSPQKDKELSSTFKNLKIEIQTKEIIHEHSHNGENFMTAVYNISPLRTVFLFSIIETRK